MRPNIALGDDLIRSARELTGIADETALVREALKALIERETARRLAAHRGPKPGLKIPRRKLAPTGTGGRIRL